MANMLENITSYLLDEYENKGKGRSYAFKGVSQRAILCKKYQQELVATTRRVCHRFFIFTNRTAIKQLSKQSQIGLYYQLPICWIKKVALHPLLMKIRRAEQIIEKLRFFEILLNNVNKLDTYS